MPPDNTIPSHKATSCTLLRSYDNSIISISIIYIIFRDKEMIRFTTILYFIFFIILIILFYIILKYFGNSHKMILFYVRRFLIQPNFFDYKFQLNIVLNLNHIYCIVQNNNGYLKLIIQNTNHYSILLLQNNNGNCKFNNLKTFVEQLYLTFL